MSYAINLVRNNEESDERYVCFNLGKNIKILNYLFRGRDLNDVKIYVSCDINIETVYTEIVNYLMWLSRCKNELTMYYENIKQDRVNDNWFDDIEVFSVDIVFNEKDDYGATITCGDTVLLDYIMEIGFDKNSVEYIR